MSTAHHRALNSVVNSYHPVATGDFGGVVAPFVQILDESMCVIREDICDWLQRYLFSEANVPPLDDACDLLERLKSGVWLARLAYKLHFKVLAANLPRCPRGVQVTSREHKLYASLRGTGPSNALGQLTAENLPPFSRPLQLAAEAQLSNSDVTTKVPSQTISDRYSTVDVGARLRIQWTARGNISAFLEWCRDLGISQTVLFETTGLGVSQLPLIIFLHFPNLLGRSQTVILLDRCAI
ncbi:unnamed protein product [Mesocestoides corti]|uniref:Calponin-homology (CH) domain-containing protein n=1 Tax=Mesocestoides corti TaxID=53468 RepID=A0A0R3UF92_MESCO|nr:unnamed protein product [Mesocestoides corti]